MHNKFIGLLTRYCLLAGSSSGTIILFLFFAKDGNVDIALWGSTENPVSSKSSSLETSVKIGHITLHYSPFFPKFPLPSQFSQECCSNSKWCSEGPPWFFQARTCAKESEILERFVVMVFTFFMVLSNPSPFSSRKEFNFEALPLKVLIKSLRPAMLS